jgi:hypothetical protein
MILRVVAGIRIGSLAIGITSAVIGICNPLYVNGTNGACWIAMFLLCAPYPLKEVTQ